MVCVNVSVCEDANKWVQLTSMELFTLSNAKHKREKIQNANADATKDPKK